MEPMSAHEKTILALAVCAALFGATVWEKAITAANLVAIKEND